jgi:hypothetical protein
MFSKSITQFHESPRQEEECDNDADVDNVHGYFVSDNG